MSATCSGPECVCGCCEQGAAPTPLAIFNRPGLPRIDYRIGTYGAFRDAMIRAAARQPALLRWTARDDGDLGMALLDCWAYVADILTFYSERAANESFLRTARLRDSVQRLAALLGYRLAPGVSATARLAFTLDAGHALALAPGLRVKSVPGPGERAVTFETSAALEASAALNASPVQGAQLTTAPWAPAPNKRRDGAPVLPPYAAIARASFRPGTEFLLWSEGSAAAEEKRVTALTERGPLLDLRFEPPAASNAFAVWEPNLTRYARRLRLFGHDAPPTWLRQFTTSAGEVRFVSVDAGAPGYDIRVPAGAALLLDRVVDGLQPGVEMLVVGPSRAERRTITAVRSVAASTGPMSATVTQVTFDQTIWSSVALRPTVRDVIVYELSTAEIRLWDKDLPAQITGSKVFVPRPEGATPLRPGRQVILDDERRRPVVTQITGVATATSFGSGPPDLLALDLQAPLPRPLVAASAVLHGNVVEATHGETVARERLGSGDATVAFQRLRLAKAPLTHVPRAGAPHGAGAELEVRVGGLLWHEAQIFYGHSPGARVYVVDVADDGTTTVRFGDGENGARAATGAEIAARYRYGTGLEGLVRAGQLTTLLDRPLGLRSVTNALAAAGAADAEPLEHARENAPGSVRTFERVVSLRDFADQALASVLVAKARADTIRGPGDPVVRLIVAGERGAALDDVALAALRADLDARRDPWRRLEIVGYGEVPLTVHAVIIARDPDRLPDDVAAAARAELLAAMDFERRSFGQPLHASDVLAVLQGTAGVVGVDLDRLGYARDSDRVAHGAPPGAVLQHVPIAGDELGTLHPSDLRITVR